MKKKTWLAILILVLVVLLLAAGFSLYLIYGSYQSVSLKGYGLSVPKQWEITQADNQLVFTDKNNEVGRFSLLYDDCELTEIPRLFGYEAAEPVVRASDRYAIKVYELSFKNGEQKVLQYVFASLPAAPPYHLVLTLPDGDEQKGRKILAKITLPAMLSCAPLKPAMAPEGEALESAVYTIKNDYGIFVYNLNRLKKISAASLLKPIQEEVLFPLSVLSLESGEEGRTVKTWYHLAKNENKTYLYTYYEWADGQFIYDNTPKVIKKITKEISDDKETVRYLADGMLLLEAPYNQYTEEMDTLLQYKGTLVGDNSRVAGLVAETLPKDIILEGVELKTDEEPYGLCLKYTMTSTERYVKEDAIDEAAFYQNALVLFSLIDNVHYIQIKVEGADTPYELYYERKTAEQQFEEQDLRNFTKDAETFTRFAEDVPKITPPDDNGSGNRTNGTRVICTRTVVVSRSMKIKHPRTGQMVSVVPYAERFGVSHLFGQPITISLHEKVENGETVMWASAGCNGSFIGTYPISSRAQFDSLIGMAQ
ncbi:MAG: DUF4825 domain-containing protein [Clostridia bacterium]|nr:DUF4825 domain-containing protein [Clostridia bacterium]